MRFRTWPVAAVALAGLLALIVLSVQTASRRAEDIYGQLDQLSIQHRRVEARFRQLRSDVQLSAIFVRDYLLDTGRVGSPDYRRSIAGFRANSAKTVRELLGLTPAPAGGAGRLDDLEQKLDDYWRSVDPLFEWTPAEKLSRSAQFLDREVLPRRQAVLSLAEEIEQVNDANLVTQRAEVSRRHLELRRDLDQLLWQSVLLGLVVAITAVIRLRVLERRSAAERQAAEDAERQTRQLSQQLVHAQEEERKTLSRELHDQVGQMLTALRMELGRIDRARGTADGALAVAVAECRQLVDNMVRTVRDLALGLRPSMLDDFGLQAALEWHVRDFTRRYGVPVALTVDGDFGGLPDRHRTCVYRAVQEALTNCVRHAAASRVTVTLRGSPGGLDVGVEDDGVGLEDDARRGGFGLRGIEERVRELDGAMTIRSAAGQGTTVAIHLPLPFAPLGGTLARAAG